MNLGPETSEQYSFGVVLRPTPRITLTADYWNIAVDNVILGSISIAQLFANIGSFPERITRTNGTITLVDLRAGNFGSRRTSGVDFMARANFDALGGTVAATIEEGHKRQSKDGEFVAPVFFIEGQVIVGNLEFGYFGVFAALNLGCGVVRVPRRT